VWFGKMEMLKVFMGVISGPDLGNGVEKWTCENFDKATPVKLPRQLHSSTSTEQRTAITT
jgi:hypothetical protein